MHNNDFHQMEDSCTVCTRPPIGSSDTRRNQSVSLALRIGLTLFPAAVAALGCTTHPSASGAAPNPLEVAVLRASQAPIVGLPDVVADDSLLGKRVRVLGWCAGAPGLLVGRRVGAWFLATPDTMVEVRGLVPKECGPSEAQQTLVLLFAQVVRAKPDGGDRLLLRLPD